MKRVSCIAVLIAGMAFWIGCKNSGTTTSAEDTETTVTSFGTGVTNPDAVMSFEQVNARLEQTDSTHAILRAKVTEVCQAKGCWMNVVDPAGGSEEEIFVQFKDYGFFMPKDLAGKEVIMEGLAYKEITSVEDLKHYAEDEGKSPDEIAGITEPVLQKKFMAFGVVLVQ